MEVKLFDGNGEGSINVKVELAPNGYYLNIFPEGYGEPGASLGNGSPITLEYYEGQLRLLVWDDIRDETAEPKVIDLEGAREDRLSKEEWDAV